MRLAPIAYYIIEILKSYRMQQASEWMNTGQERKYRYACLIFEIHLQMSGSSCMCCMVDRQVNGKKKKLITFAAIFFS